MDISQLIKTKRDGNQAASRPLHILFATSEVAPFSKTGGLGDVAASLPAALAARGHHVNIITPLYGHIDPEEYHLSKRLRVVEVPRKGLRQNKLTTTIWEGHLRGGVRVFFVENEEFFGRDGLYGYDGDAFEDNAARFSFFSRAIIEFVLANDVPVDIIHCNDWHTALAPVYAAHYYEDDFLDRAFIFTIHNLAHQGVFGDAQFDDTGLPRGKFFTGGDLRGENGEGINFLRAGLLYSDHVTTVSPTHASEIQTETGSFGLTETLRGCQDILSGILNGADYSVWSPSVDHKIELRYDVDSLNNKRRNKAALQHRFHLPGRPTLPLLGFIGRLAEQKGLEILIPALRKLLKQFESEREGFQVVFLGEGDKSYERRLQALQRDFPKRVSVHVGYEEEIAHQIQAGTDLLLVPSKFEPCGLTQIYALRYGTLPLVHATGGLADTVVDADDARSTKGTGFTFESFDEESLIAAIERATSSYKNYRRWRPLMINAMAQDFSWNESAKSYEEIYIDTLYEPLDGEEEE